MDGRLELIAGDLSSAVSDLQAKAAHLQAQARKLRLLLELPDETRTGLDAAQRLAVAIEQERRVIDLDELDRVLEDLRTWIVQERAELDRSQTRPRVVVAAVRSSR